MKKHILLYLLIGGFTFYSSSIYSQQRGQQQQQQEAEVKIPLQLKPKRMDLINKVSNNSIAQQQPFFSDNEIENIKEMLRVEKKLGEENLINKNIVPQYRNIFLGFTPTQNFQRINLAYGYSTTLVFLDKNGNPWDIFDISMGDSSIADVQFRQKNILTFVPQRRTGKTNLTLTFVDSKLPSSLELILNDETVDYITQIDVQGYGNQSPIETTVLSRSGANTIRDLSYLAKFEETFISEIMTNTKPEGVEEKDVFINSKLINDNEFRVFVKDSFLYVRTRHTAHSPEPLLTRFGPDGVTKVYKIPFISAPMFIIDGRSEIINIR